MEVAALPHGRVGVRDSKDKTGPALVFASDGWGAFISGVKNGDFDIQS
ncbi:hypothetical protein FHR32_004771 [Streptosporangium album]|uniref:DUF397 domain-containing protein n=1 Tax=Streptosporangium album TaxID=47479 RepID=A0A7W7S013_9ACTN|nr:hypothetical protein [Streptosporangium album]